ncbi:cupin domain-containing protein [Halobellus rubicundus]|uniref:Cupin domain-containing protein n=1 Tax=Halobellus rubicundus TaxID=2996466 RepID=A0ABD5MDJ3_9EURY
MSHTKSHYTDGDEKAPGMFFLREELDCENLGFTVVEVDAGWEGMKHDHEDRDHEEVYYLVDGTASLEIDGDTVDLDPGDAVRVAPEAVRTLTADEDSTLVVAGAP